MDLRHRHRHATGETGETQHRQQRVGRKAEPARRVCDEGARHIAANHRGAPPQRQQKRQHGQGAEGANADMGGPPALGRDEMLHDRRPDRAAEIIAARDDGDGNAAAAGEPLRTVGDQRPERGGGAEPDEGVHERKHHEAVGEAGGDITDGERERAADHRRPDAEAVGEPPHRHAAAGKSDHRQRKRQRSIRAGDGELGLHRRQHDRHRPHADAADGAEHHGGDEPQPGEGGFDPGVKSSKSQHCLGVFPGASLSASCRGSL